MVASTGTIIQIAKQKIYLIKFWDFEVTYEHRFMTAPIHDDSAKANH